MVAKPTAIKSIADPTQNVKDLMEASLKALENESHLRATLVGEQIHRLEEAVGNSAHLRDTQLAAVEALAIVRATHAKELRDSESKRLDAIRATDVAAVSTAAVQAQAAISALATTATATAETLRNQVTATALTIANQTDRIVSPILERIATLEKLSYTGLGKQAVVDPQMERLTLLVERLASSDAVVSGKTEGMTSTAKIILSLVGMVGTLLTIGAILVSVIVFLNRAPANAAPQVIYVPAPQGSLLPTTPPGVVPR